MAGRVKPRPRNKTVPNADAINGLRADFDTTEEGGFFQPDTDEYFEPLQGAGNLRRPNSSFAFSTNVETEQILSLTVINDAQVDSADIIVLTSDDLNTSVGFEKETYVLREQSNAQEFNGQSFSSSNESSPKLINGSNNGTFKSAVVVIEDADSKVIQLGNDNDSRSGSNGINYIYGGAGGDTISGKGKSDLLRGEAGNDTLRGEGGDDVLLGEGGNDSIKGGDGDDYLNGGSGNDKIVGGQGNDILDGSTGNDTLEGGSGDDRYIVDSLKDRIVDSRGTGRETVESSVTWTLGDGLDFLLLTGEDAIDGTGNDFNNIIRGNDNNNTLAGREGADTLIGGFGNDVLIGGNGGDRFVFGIPSNKTGSLSEQFFREGVDVVRDFNPTQGDKLQITAEAFTDPFSGTPPSPENFSYDQSTGALFFNGFQFATLEGNPALNINTDIILT